MKEVRNDRRKEFEKRKITRKVYCKDIIRQNDREFEKEYLKILKKN